jgi:site-specific recombinase XerD
MATFKICIFEKHVKSNGTYPVSIRVCWKRKYGYMKTEYYATLKQINQKPYYDEKGVKKHFFALKDKFIINDLNARIAKYEDLKVKKLGHNIELYTAQDLAEYFKREGAPGTDSSIDFIEFAKLHCKRLDDKGRKTTADTLRRTINAVTDFCSGRGKISITEINVKFLSQFENYLQGKRTLKRINQFGKEVSTEKKGLSAISIHDYMTDIRTLFNAAINEFNDEDRGEIRIKHYPFRKYKLQKGPEPDKRVLKVEQIRSIRDVSDTKLIQKRSILARDVFILSFYLAGTNTADLFDVKKSSYKNGRLSYYRQKTRARRQDKAYISIKVFPESLPLFEKYRDKKGLRVFNFANSYADYHTFNANINKGLKKVAEICKIEEDLSTYYARFSFATIARNDCGVSKDDINLSLDHVDTSLKMADAYIKKDWSIVDKAVRAVLDLLNKKIIA